MTQPVYFLNPPEACQICEGDFRAVLYDARTRMGPWACMCSGCFTRYGVGLGQGRGQRYLRQADSRFLKTEG